jgi:hypothetical protein
MSATAVAKLDGRVPYLPSNGDIDLEKSVIDLVSAHAIEIVSIAAMVSNKRMIAKRASDRWPFRGR